MTSSATGLQQDRPTTSPWFRSASYDLLLILAVPFVTWPLVKSAEVAFGADLLAALILLTATGHYFATFVRAYGDLALFRRFRLRFVLAPIVLLATCIGAFATGNDGPLLLVTTAWAFWHWLAQAFGFARIYDIKVGSFRPLTAWLDKALVVMGFVGAATLNPGSIATFGKVVLDAGVPLPSATTFAQLQLVVLVAIAIVVLAYVVNLARTIVRREPWSWQKQFMHVTTIGYYWFAFGWLPNVLIGYVLYELFHDIQYYAITWLTCRQRAQRPGVASWFRAMFRPSWLAALVFVGLMCAIGGVDALGRHRWFDAGSGHRIWLGAFVAIALLHYYYDGFIWKARESDLGSDLGIRGGRAAAIVPGLRHAGLWALFFVPLIAVQAFGHRDLSVRERAEALVAVAPGDFATRADLALALAGAGDLDAALGHYLASLSANPDNAEVRVNFGAALDLWGDLRGAAQQYRRVLEYRDSGGAHARANVNLGVLLLAGGDRAEAERYLAEGARLGGENPIARLLGLAAALPVDEVDRRVALLRGALQLDPGLFEAHVALGPIMQRRGLLGEAAEHFAAALRRAPDHVPSLVGLADVQLELALVEAARATVQRALTVAPRDPEVQRLKVRLGL